jgi:hypothetical protein
MSVNLSSQDNTQKPNVVLAHGQQPICVEGEVNIGGSPPMHLPTEEEQRRGFYVAEPATFVTQYYPRYKYAIGARFGQQAQPRPNPIMDNPPATSETIEVAVNTQEGEGTPVDRLAEQAGHDSEFQQTQKEGGVTQDVNS